MIQFPNPYGLTIFKVISSEAQVLFDFVIVSHRLMVTQVLLFFITLILQVLKIFLWEVLILSALQVWTLQQVQLEYTMQTKL